ncbi:hypothetical protein V2H45_16370 [Tumidithrix elongata RA019]|uniref:Uncharacterized protein n=1 Tax=Tumidithrix elongata BACA0141 TaxID=2716417 RepID=A0AAW9PZK7_9CYAN|nr:hypothetical protein [Tumidithrix elongata RA019]
MADTYLSAPKIFEIAKSSYQRVIYQTPESTDGGKDDATIAILFSAMTVEVFLNELIELARDREESDAKSLFSVCKPLLEAHKELETRLFEASRSTSDTPFVKGNQPFQDFNLLVRVRNRIVHLLAGDTPTNGLIREHVKILSDLRSRKLIVDDRQVLINREQEGLIEKYKSLLSDQEINSIPVPFLYSVSTNSVAEWSLKVASEIITSFVNTMRDSGFKNHLQQHVKFFQIEPDNLSDLQEWYKMILKFGCSTSNEFIEKIRKKELVVSFPDVIKEV